MSAPLVVTIPHRLGKEEAARRLKVGIGNARANYRQLLTVEDEVWSGDCLSFRVRALGQSAGGIIEVRDDALRLEVSLPWLLAKLTDRFVPAIQKSGTLLLEKK